MKNILISTTLILLLNTLSFAQQKIIGQLLDSETNIPLEGATIELLNSTKLASAISTSGGKFVFTDLKKNYYTIKISHLGYQTIEKQISPSSEKILFYLKLASIITDEIIIVATQASRKTPMTYSNIEKKEIIAQNTGKDFPYLLENTASVVTTSDAGAGVGYTGIRIRGSDATRINVTLNGIPYNDSESQMVYWVNLPDIASSVESIQVQRGVGTSTNGAAAFGASINIQTSKPSVKPYATINTSFGSFNTQKYALLIGTGLLNDKFTFDGRLSKIKSKGYIDRAKSLLNSYYLSGGYYGKNMSLKLNIFSGHEITYQSWYGSPESRIKNNKDEMLEYINRNGLDEQEAENLLNSGRTYNFYTYDNQIDNYTQTHYQALYTIGGNNSDIVLNTALHYTKGSGYFEEFKKDQKLSDYAIKQPIIGNNTSNLIRKRWLDNDFYGTTFSVIYDTPSKIDVILGGSWNRYIGDHFGEIVWLQYNNNTAIRENFYKNKGLKTDATIYLKFNWSLIDKLSIFADYQYRNIKYEIDGNDQQQDIYEDHKYNFMNPKVGISYLISSNRNAYLSFSLGNKEPNRNDFVNSENSKVPKHELVRDLEVGYKQENKNIKFHTNLYLMDYKDQLILTGKLNNSGEPLRVNVDKSYRMGLEVEASIKINTMIALSGNTTFSRNIIKNFNEVVYDYGINWELSSPNEINIKHRNTDISFSPTITAGGSLTFYPTKGFEVIWTQKYVSKQYLDNTKNEARKIEGYFISDVRASYKLSIPSIKQVSINVSIYNLFNNLYSANGYTWGYRGGGNTIQENFYFPQAGTHFIAGININL